jgi:hypothetical protein
MPKNNSDFSSDPKEYYFDYDFGEAPDGAASFFITPQKEYDNGEGLLDTTNGIEEILYESGFVRCCDSEYRYMIGYDDGGLQEAIDILVNLGMIKNKLDHW